MAKSKFKSSSTYNSAKQSDSDISIAGLITIISVIPLGMVLLLSFFQRVPVDDLTRDVTAVGQLPAYSGFLSQICIFFWAAAAAVCLFSATVLSGRRENGLRRFLLTSAALTFFLGLDDAFLLHETVFPSLGIPENAIYLSYAVFFLWYLYKFYRVIYKTNFRPLVTALLFFGLSVFLDLVYLIGPITFLFKGPIFSLIEDATKFIGIVSWVVYFFQVGQWSIKSGGAGAAS